MKRLQQLIDEHRRALDLTWEGLDALSAQKGQRISADMWETWARGGWENLPKTKVIKAMAATLDLTPAEVLAAAEVSLGLFTSVEDQSPEVRAMAATMGRRTPEEQALLLDMLRQGIAMLDAGSERSNASDA